MALFDVDFIFSCPCFVSKIQKVILKSTKKYEIAACVGRKHVDHFKEERTIFVCCFYHVLEGMQFDTYNCLHYYKRAYFEMCYEGSMYKAKKCF